MKYVFTLSLLLLFISCSKTDDDISVDPAEPTNVQVSEEGIKFVGKANDGALITIQILDNALSLILDHTDMYPAGSLDELKEACFYQARFNIVINGTLINGNTIDINCPVADTPPTDLERLDFAFTNSTLPSPNFETERLCSGATGGLRYDALRDLTKLPVLSDSIRYCIGTDNKTYKIVINKLGGIGLYFPTKFNFLNRTVSGVISIIDANNEALNLVIDSI